jgi:hypothetical protein
MSKTLAKLWLWIVSIGLVILNGIACYHEIHILWFELMSFGIAAVLIITLIALIEVQGGHDGW